MDIKYKLYPHPVLISETDDYMNSTFTFNALVKKGIREICFSFDMDLKNDGMNAMIKEGSAEFLVHIECPKTCYRVIVKSDEVTFEKKIPEKQLNGKVSICAFVVAKKDLTSFTDKDLSPDYGGASFSVDKGSILAIGGQYDLNVINDTETLTKVSSIFTICKYAADTDESMKIDIEGEKIVIALSDKSFQDYRILTNMPGFLPVFHAMVIVPALIYVFETLYREGTEEYESHRWYVAIKKALERYEIILDKNTLEDITSYELAQRLMDLPIGRALNAITMIDDSEEE